MSAANSAALLTLFADPAARRRDFYTEVTALCDNQVNMPYDAAKSALKRVFGFVCHLCGVALQMDVHHAALLCAWYNDVDTFKELQRTYELNERVSWHTKLCFLSPTPRLSSTCALGSAKAPEVRSLATASTSTADDSPDAELRALLTDRRLVRVSDKMLVYSHLVGKAAGFLSDCCEPPSWECVRSTAYWRVEGRLWWNASAGAVDEATAPL